MTPLEARDIIFNVFKTVWDATGFIAVYDDVPSTPPNTDTSWARVTMQHFSGRQASLAGELGARRWENRGLVTAQIFAPIGDGKTQVYTLSELVRNGYRDAKNLSVWFRDPRINEVGNDGAWEQINVLVNFEYDDVR